MPRLCSGGGLLLEIGPAIHDEAVALLADHPDLQVESTIKDLAGHPRIVQATKK